jgi:hypothetical protein
MEVMNGVHTSRTPEQVTHVKEKESHPRLEASDETNVIVTSSDPRLVSLLSFTLRHHVVEASSLPLLTSITQPSLKKLKHRTQIKRNKAGL